ncbi:NADH dehydrogenase [ubiquinone] 1 beta subcomplex subunit 4 [Condylostylus longicornis]|uniref:NADH dehydrogenase [ubiquinone] 1 beta subcomplex subunit 4 n=1 Tax=Condylostylus longicornis TaxID=2530218 RepID=UPI00244E20E8|nr:NADH dehydrogenase [ubiquinone] 1 beta subcomplex subunit 4 [Condylostylus longicornis]
MLSEAQKQICLEKHKKAMDLRKEYLKQSSNPFRHGTGEGGTLFDAGVARFQAMKVNHYEHFKPTYKSFKVGMLAVFLPIAVYAWMMKTERDGREKQYRTGQVAYKDRQFKYI